MKKALILHGTNSTSKSNWFPWLKDELEKVGWIVWAPDLPKSDEPNIERYNKAILSNRNWGFDDMTTIIGHSSGAVAALGLLQALPRETVVEKVVLIGSFKNNLNWPNLDGLFKEPFKFEQIKKRAKRFIFIHSNDDPYCPLDHAEYLSEKLGGDLTVIAGQKHFSEETDPKYTSFPYLRDLLIENDSKTE